MIARNNPVDYQQIVHNLSSNPYFLAFFGKQGSGAVIAPGISGQLFKVYKNCLKQARLVRHIQTQSRAVAKHAHFKKTRTEDQSHENERTLHQVDYKSRSRE
jgi:hypothetical protein